MNAQLNVEQVQQLQRKNKGVIRLLYDHMMGEQQKTISTCLMFNNAARPKAYFKMWIMMNQRLVTVDRLAKWGVEVEKTCVLCCHDPNPGREWHPHLPSYVSEPTNLNLNISNIINRKQCGRLKTH